MLRQRALSIMHRRLTRSFLFNSFPLYILRRLTDRSPVYFQAEEFLRVSLLSLAPFHLFPASEYIFPSDISGVRDLLFTAHSHRKTNIDFPGNP